MNPPARSSEQDGRQQLIHQAIEVARRAHIALQIHTMVRQDPQRARHHTISAAIATGSQPATRGQHTIAGPAIRALARQRVGRPAIHGILPRPIRRRHGFQF